MQPNVKENMKVSVCALKAADNETLTGSTLDMANWEGVAFYAVALEGEALAFSIKAQQDSASNMATAADLEGTALAFSTTIPAKGQALLDIFRPQERYVRALVTVPDAIAATPTALIAIQYGPRQFPVTQPGSAEAHVSPDEGTA